MNSKTEFYFELMCSPRELYRVHNITACEKWIDVINSSLIYLKFWASLSLKFKRTSEYLQKNQAEAIFIDEKTGEIKSDKKPKKKARRANPSLHSNDEEALLEDSTLTHGIRYESFVLLDLLGSGSFGKVFKVLLKTTGDIYAMKAINKKFLRRNNQLRYAITECNVLKQTNCPFIVKLHFSFQTQDYLYMVLDYCEGGDMGFILRDSLFDEEEAQFYIAELTVAIEHLHSLDIIYRDLKPDNILIDSENHIKLADFGLAKENVGSNSLTKSFCGSAAYLSPEMLSKRGVGKAADIYGIGAVLYEMICGSPPFYANDINTLYSNITKNELKLHDYFSDELKDFLQRIISLVPEKRIGVKNFNEIKMHPWFDAIDWNLLEKRKLPPPINLMELKADLPNHHKKKAKCEFEDTDYAESNRDSTRVMEFTFVRPHSPEDHSK